MVKEFIYEKVRELGKIGESSVEIGHYMVNGQVTTDKVYLVTNFTRKNGKEENWERAICSVVDAKELGMLLMEVEEK